jgi:hypothetical protein
MEAVPANPRPGVVDLRSQEEHKRQDAVFPFAGIALAEQQGRLRQWPTTVDLILDSIKVYSVLA